LTQAHSAVIVFCKEGATMAIIQDKSGPVMGYRFVSILTAILLLVQPILIGQYLAHGNRDYKDAHAILGDVLQLTCLIQVILAFLSRRTFGIGLFFHNLALLVLVVIQTFLGHAASDGHENPKAIHVPLGVLLFGMGIFAPFLGFFDLRSQRRLNASTENR
jgi:hypothetical protein